MATQGIVSIVQDGKTVVKAIAGCDGFNAPLLALLCRDRRWFDIEAVHEAAQEVGFGCADCLVAMDADAMIYECEMSGEQLAFYREKFADPHFNPRWKQGTANFVEVVEIPVESEAP